MPFPRPRPPLPGQARVWLPALAGATAVSLVGGCTGTGEARSAGPAPAVSAPAQLWDEPPLPPRPADGKGSTDTRPAPLHGVPDVPSGDIRRASWLNIVKAQTRAGGDGHTGPQFGQGTLREIRRCTADRRQQAKCPVRAPRYRDLNGDGKDELIVGIAEGTDDLLAIWVFTVRDKKVTRIMDAAARPLSVEVTGQDVILREPSDSAGYEMRTVYSWDERAQAMELRAMEFDPRRPGVPGRTAPARPRATR
ncbi:hypothetical protein [Streptomyces rimosus]|uniref:hypothetical protein n=1 Tax=Streptomyces rimosus TaxID=1927 RepID=UPI000B272D20|nr:hypothetical protein [Streptomyces rimosus]